MLYLCPGILIIRSQSRPYPKFYQLALFPPLNEDKSVTSDLVRGHFAGDPVLADFSDSAVCIGHYVHVFVDPKNGNRPILIPESWRSELAKIKS